MSYELPVDDRALADGLPCAYCVFCQSLFPQNTRYCCHISYYIKRLTTFDKYMYYFDLLQFTSHTQSLYQPTWRVIIFYDAQKCSIVSELSNSKPTAWMITHLYRGVTSSKISS